MVEGHPRVRYDLGAGEYDLMLSYVNASDGIWHEITVYRYGNQVIFSMDQSEGVFFNESLPLDEHRELIVNFEQQTYAGADGRYLNRHHTTPTISEVFVDSCVRDIRMAGEWLPLDPSENDASVAATVAGEVDTDDTCEAGDVCNGVVCPVGQNCVNYWRMPYCV